MAKIPKRRNLNLALVRRIMRNQNVHKAILFGFAALGTDTQKSDLDIIIIQETERRFFDRFDEFNEIYEALYGRDVDLLIYTPDELQTIMHRPFIKRILAEGKTIYERREKQKRSSTLNTGRGL